MCFSAGVGVRLSALPTYIILEYWYSANCAKVPAASGDAVGPSGEAALRPSADDSSILSTKNIY